MRTNKKQAFTMVELLVVLVILGILFVVLMANVDFTTEEAKSTGAMNLLHSYQTAANTVGLQYTGFTNDMTELVYQLNKKLDPELQVFIVGNEIHTNAEDPWGTTIKIEYSEPVDSKGQIKFTSAGADTVFDTGDDIITLLRCNMENEIVIENPVNDPNHTHEYTQEVTGREFIYSEANCQQVAKYYRSCICGAKGDTTFEAGAKNFDKHAATIDAFVPYDEESHKFTRTCSACASVIQQSYELHQVEDGVQCVLCGDLTHRHDYTRELQLPEYKKNDATCSAPLTYFKSCSCGQKGTATFTVGTAREHDFSKRSLDYFVSGATCASPAKYYLTCTYCDAKGTETYAYGNRDESNHIGGEIIQFVNIDDTKHTKKVICMGCGFSKSETTENHFEGCGCHTHQYFEEVVTTDYLKTGATCTGKAVYYTSCECGKSSQDTADENTFESGCVLGHAPASTPTWNSGHSIATVKCTRCTQTWSGNSIKNVTTTPNCTTDEKFSHDVTINVNGINKNFNCGVSHTGSKAPGIHTGSAINGGTAGVHTKYSCCGATISSTHSYTAATCTAPKTCACGYKDGSALGHTPATTATWDANHTKVTVSCTRTGCSQTWSSTSIGTTTTRTATCTLEQQYKHTTTFSVNGTSKTFTCSTTHTGSKNSSNHTGSVVNVGSASVCTKYNCCNATKSSTHNYGSATCLDPAKCSVCGYSTGSALGHDYSVVVTEPTCTTTGTNKCSRCTATTTIDELGHTPGAAATCTTAQKCTVCNATIANAKGHNYQTQSAATCTAAEVEKCSRCGGTRTGDAALGHNIVNGGTSAIHTKCGRCGVTLSSTHSYTATSTSATCRSCACGYKDTTHDYGDATCTEAATCSTCGYSSGIALGHDYTVVVTEVTCTANGTMKCSRCSATTTITAPGHNYQTQTAATCGSAEVEKCSRCSATRTGDPATGKHSYGSYRAYGSTTHRRTCSVCGAGQTANCSFTYRTGVVATSGSCTVAPTYYYECSTCTNRDGSTYTGTVPGHDPEYGGVASQHTYCVTCGITLSTTHSYSVTTAATCASTGIETCACGYSRTIAKSSSHTGPITSTCTATCTTSGYTVSTCLKCGSETGRMYEGMLGHSYTSSGTCSRCGAACSHSYRSSYTPMGSAKHHVSKVCTICNYSTGTSLEACYPALLVDDIMAQCVCGNEVARLN